MKYVDEKYTASFTDRQLFRIQRALESSREISTKEWVEVVAIVTQARGFINEQAREQCCCNACEWTGPTVDTVMLGDVGPLCPQCHETTEPV